MKIDFLTQIKLAGLPKPEPEFKFHPTRKWRADWAWPEEKLIVEMEGGIFGSSRRGQKAGWHQSISGMLDDMDKYNQMALLGYRLLRFTPQQMDDGPAVRTINLWFKMHRRFGV
jgi:very-short-patch-repair endonuclease